MATESKNSAVLQTCLAEQHHQHTNGLPEVDRLRPPFFLAVWIEKKADAACILFNLSSQ